MYIPTDERTVTDEQFFQALNLDYPGLETVKELYQKQDIASAKQALLYYFEHRSGVHYLFDYRSLPLTPIDTDSMPCAFQASLGLSGSLKEFCLYAGNQLLKHIYVIPGNRGTINLGKNFEFPIHFNFLKEKETKCNHLLLFVRGAIFEYLYVLYHETGNPEVLRTFEDFLGFFFDTYPLVVCNTDPDASRFQFDDERCVMSAGFLTMTYTSLLYTKAFYEIDSELAFGVLKRLWFIGLQFRRFDKDYYRPYNHHMWERGIVPFILSVMFPEFSDFTPMKSIGKSVVCQHIKDDFNAKGGYSEHSIAYWSGATLREMLYRCIYISRLNQEELLDREAEQKLTASFQVLAQIAPPHTRYPSLGDNRSPEVTPILSLGANALQDTFCKEVFNIRTHKQKEAILTPLDYCSDVTGFVCGKSGYDEKANYFLMSAKNNCGYTGHNHMDMLSLFLSIRGVPFIDEPDAGTMYHKVRLGSPQRGFMYNMTSHNTVLAFGKPIAPDFMYADSWGTYRPDSPVTAFLSRPSGMYVAAYHSAYTFCCHTRRILFNRQKGLLIQERIDRGNRYPAAHIQRWHLAKGIEATLLNENSVLLSNGEVQVLCLWDCPASIHIYRNDILYPEIISEYENLSYTIDVSFQGNTDEELDYEATVLNTAFLDVTKHNNISQIAAFSKKLFSFMDYSDMEKAILDFEDIYF